MGDAAESSPPTPPADLLQGRMRLPELILRLCAIPLCVASLWLIATNRQVNDTYGRLQYTDLTGLKYMVWVDAISAGYAMFAVLSSSLRWLSSAWVFFVSDQVTAYLLVTSGSAVAEVLYLAYKGDRDVSWSKACDYVGRFCDRAKLALILHFLALGCFIGLSLISAYRVFSKFGDHSVQSSHKERSEQDV